MSDFPPPPPIAVPPEPNWFAASYALTIQSFRQHFQFFVVFLLMPAVIAGLAVWELAEAATIKFDPNSFSMSAIFEQTNAGWLVLVAWGVLLAIGVMHVGFTNMVFDRRESEVEVTPFAAFSTWRILVFRFLAQLVVVAGIAILGALAGTVGVIAAAFLIAFVLISNSGWVDLTQPQTVKLSVPDLSFAAKLGRFLGAAITAMFIWFVFDSLANLLISLGSLAGELGEIDFTQDWERPATAFLGSSEWVSALRSVFSTVGLMFASAFWVNSRLFIKRSNVEAV